MKHADMGDEETTRSGLFIDQMRIIKEMRDRDKKSGRPAESIRPRVMLWENVPGAFSSGTPKGADFAAVLEEVIKVCQPGASVSVRIPDRGWTKAGVIYDSDGAWSLAWRLTDAQYFGVPQRRKRICLLVDFNGPSAPWILFDPQYERTTESGEPISLVRDTGAQPGREVQSQPESLRGNSAESGEEGQRTSAGTADGLGAPGSYTLKIRGGVEVDSNGRKAGKGALIQTEMSGTLGVSQDQTLFQMAIPLEGNGGRPSHQGNGYGNNGDPSFTLNSTEHHGVAVDVYNQTVDGDIAPSLTAASGGSNTSGPKVMGFKPRNSAKARSLGCEEQIAPTINTDENYGVVTYGFEPGAAKRLDPDNRMNEECSPTLRSNMGDNQLGVAVCSKAFGISSYDSNAMKSPNPHSGIYEADTARTLDLNGGSPACNQGGIAVVGLTNRSYVSGDTAETLRAESHGAIPIAFTQNQRDEVRNLGDKSGAIQAEPGMKQQTFICQK